jgi:hypothetical protein
VCKKNKHHSQLNKNYYDGLREAEAAHKVRSAQQEESRAAEAAAIANMLGKCKPPPYTKIKVNKPFGRVRLADFNDSEAQACDCDPAGDNPCGPDSNCLNRNLNTECVSALCRAGDRCENQKFQRREYPNVVPFPTPGKGWGLKSSQDIPAGNQFIFWTSRYFHRRYQILVEFFLVDSLSCSTGYSL